MALRIGVCDDTRMIRLGNETFFGLDDDGVTWWGSNLPEGLHDKLWGRQSWLPDVQFVALHPSKRSNYFVQFTDWDTAWNGPETLSKYLYSGFRQGCEVDVMCFAPNDGWFVKWDDGDIGSKNLPKGLHNQVHGRHNSMPGDAASTVEYISVGEHGEWFVRYENGDWRSGSVPKDLNETVTEIHNDDEEVVLMELGSNGNWVLITEE